MKIRDMSDTNLNPAKATLFIATFTSPFHKHKNETNPRNLVKGEPIDAFRKEFRVQWRTRLVM